VAARFLKKNRYRILARDFRCAAGQIDLIALRRGVVVFVEVKTRTSATHVDKLPVHPSQQARIVRAAQLFLARGKLTNRAVRFDVIFIAWPPSQKPTVEHIEDAFVPGLH